MSKNTLEFFDKAKEAIVKAGFQAEIDLVESRKFENTTPAQFFQEYAFVVLSAGMRNQVAWKIAKRFADSSYDLTVIRHPGKRLAITSVLQTYHSWFNKLKECNDYDGMSKLLLSMPFIGNITVHHLMRNLGIDTAKPDRWLVRLASYFGFPDPFAICRFISQIRDIRMGTADVILWRFCNLYPKQVMDMINNGS